jgi:hypothetical protein
LKAQNGQETLCAQTSLASSESSIDEKIAYSSSRVALLRHPFIVPLVGEQAGADPNFLAEISNIMAIDDHANPLRVVGEGEKPDNHLPT